MPPAHNLILVRTGTVISTFSCSLFAPEMYLEKVQVVVQTKVQYSPEKFHEHVVFWFLSQLVCRLCASPVHSWIPPHLIPGLQIQTWTFFCKVFYFLHRTLWGCGRELAHNRLRGRWGRSSTPRTELLLRSSQVGGWWLKLSWFLLPIRHTLTTNTCWPSKLLYKHSRWSQRRRHLTRIIQAWHGWRKVGALCKEGSFAAKRANFHKDLQFEKETRIFMYTLACALNTMKRLLCLCCTTTFTNETYVN